MILKLTLSVLCLGGLAIGFAAHAAEDSKNPNAIDAVHQLPVLRKIVFEREPIFGAEERDRVPWLPLGLVNRLHAGTRVRVIRSELLFKEGERVSRDAIAESERKLRQTGFFGETQILPVYVSSDSVDVLVRTREIWTTEVNFQYERFEEQKIWALSFRERNFLGLAQSVQFSRRQDDDRSTGSVSIGNRQLFDGTWRGGFSLSDSDDGAASAWFLQKPFFQTDADWSLGGGTSHRSARVRMYVEGEGYVRPSGDFTEGEFFVMRKASSSESAVFRLGVGLRASKQRFAPESGLELRDATGGLGRTTRFDPTETENRH